MKKTMNRIRLTNMKKLLPSFLLLLSVSITSCANVTLEEENEAAKGRTFASTTASTTVPEDSIAPTTDDGVLPRDENGYWDFEKIFRTGMKREYEEQAEYFMSILRSEEYAQEFPGLPDNIYVDFYPSFNTISLDYDGEPLFAACSVPCNLLGLLEDSERIAVLVTCWGSIAKEGHITQEELEQIMDEYEALGMEIYRDVDWEKMPADSFIVLLSNKNWRADASSRTGVVINSEFTPEELEGTISSKCIFRTNGSATNADGVNWRYALFGAETNG